VRTRHINFLCELSALCGKFDLTVLLSILYLRINNIKRRYSEMQKTIEVVYEKGVFKPLEPVELEEGEHVKIRMEEKKRRKIDFEPIKLKNRISIKKIEELRSELWSSF
jgi:predicted DNA-binding antitoxin AbrB/MazE fold protein